MKVCDLGVSFKNWDGLLQYDYYDDGDDDNVLGTLTVRQKDNRRPFSCLSHIVRKLTQTL